ncbi:MAG TPA: aminoglycoside phosphotransferase family protein, partial [Streptosporangiaceae bacterium]
MPDGPVIDIEDVRTRLSRRFGPQVAAWCADLPALAGDLAVRWGLRLGPPWPKGGTSVVLPCASDDGEQLVLKLTPDLALAADEAAALDMWQACSQVVTPRDADLDRGALLLERVVPGTRLADEPDQWPLPEVAPMLAQLWREPAGRDRPGLPGLRERAEFVFEVTQRRL